MMDNGGKIITGLIVFVLVFTLPLWWHLGMDLKTPNLERPKDAVACVGNSDYMRTSHMKLLDDWRHSVVRGQGHIYVGENGKNFEMSLTKECMSCHDDKKKFCDQCHNYLAVVPYCWDCHLTPEQVKESK